MAPIAVPSHAVILQSRLSPLDAPPRFELLFIIWLVVLVSLISGRRINNNRWSSDSILVITGATLILTDRGVTTTLSVIVQIVIVVSTVPIYRTLSVIAHPISTHFIRLILNNARWVREVLDRVPLEGVGRVL
jgi:hypothetical protein